VPIKISFLGIADDLINIAHALLCGENIEKIGTYQLSPTNYTIKIPRCCATAARIIKLETLRVIRCHESRSGHLGNGAR